MNRTFLLALILTLLRNPVATAQIIPDQTLTSPSTVSNFSSFIEITGGTREGNTLFHSFQEFSVPKSAIASFQSIDPDINTIISRITGSQRSRINGTIQALTRDGLRSTADFFLINPNGIVFAPNARLNLGGSFIATTAEQIVFADGTTFSTDPTQDTLLLTITAPVGLQFGQRPGPIQVRSPNTEPDIDIDATGFRIQRGLSVQPAQTLALVGGKINLTHGILNAQSGRLEIGGVGDFTTVDLISTPRRLRLSYDAVETFSDIQIEQNSLLNVTPAGPRSPDDDPPTLGAGSMHLQGHRITITENSSLLANTEGVRGDRTGISIHASTLNLRNSLISSTTFGAGQSGHIRIEGDRLNIRRGGQIFTNVAGNVIGPKLPRDAARTSTGTAGTIRIIVDALDIRGRTVSPSDTDTLEFPIQPEILQSGIRSAVLSGASGNGGNIRLTTNTLTITEGGQIGADTRGSGNTGRIRVDAEEVQITGVALTQSLRQSRNQPLTQQEKRPVINDDGLTLPSTISAVVDEGASGRGGNITITAETLTVDAGATVQTSTIGIGDAGNVRVNVTGLSRLNGTVDLSPVAAEDLPSGLYSFSGGVSSDRLTIGGNTPSRQEATGRGGIVRVNTGELSVSDRAVIAVGSLNPNREDADGAGRIAIRADQIRLDDAGALLSATASGDGGDIRVRVDEADILLLRQGSLIESTAGLENAGGNGGNITVNAGFVLATPQENSDIQANAFTGNGGQVQVTTQGLFGIEPRPSVTPLSDITASSAFGIQGLITIDDLGIDPVQRVAELPGDIAPPPLSQGCAPGAGQGRFIAIGQGGRPPGSGDLIDSTFGWEDVVPADYATYVPITEAQTWTVGDRGHVILQSEPKHEGVQLTCHL